MVSRLTRNQLPGNRLRVRLPCPPLPWCLSYPILDFFDFFVRQSDRNGVNQFLLTEGKFLNERRMRNGNFQCSPLQADDTGHGIKRRTDRLFPSVVDSIRIAPSLEAVQNDQLRQNVTELGKAPFRWRKRRSFGCFFHGDVTDLGRRLSPKAGGRFGEADSTFCKTPTSVETPGSTVPR